MTDVSKTRGKRNSRYLQRCDQCCPLCKHQCRLMGRHMITLHECSQHVWGRKALTLKDGFEYPEILNEETA